MRCRPRLLRLVACALGVEGYRKRKYLSGTRPGNESYKFEVSSRPDDRARDQSLRVASMGKWRPALTRSGILLTSLSIFNCLLGAEEHMNQNRLRAVLLCL